MVLSCMSELQALQYLSLTRVSLINAVHLGQSISVNAIANPSFGRSAHRDTALSWTQVGFRGGHYQHVVSVFKSSSLEYIPKVLFRSPTAFWSCSHRALVNRSKSLMLKCLDSQLDRSSVVLVERDFEGWKPKGAERDVF